jgi:cyclophilin family peptidyl-prolyl cis-trans isomerase
MVLVGCGQVNTFEHQLQIKAVDTEQPVANAAVRAEMGVRDFSEAVSDSDGIARLAINQEYRDAWAKVIVEADAYEKQSFLVKLVDDHPTNVVRLQPPVEETAPAEEALAPTEEGDAANENAAGEMESHSEDVAMESDPAESVPPGELAGVPPAERANYYQAKPELTIEAGKSYQATIHTGKGDIVLSLDAAASPEHVNNFIFLSNQGFYDGLTFHRVEPGFVIQGGDPLGSGQGGPGYTVPGEFDLLHGEGALAMARLPDDVNPNRESSGSQFYITLAPTPFLDGQYSVFGQVEEGMDVVQSIEIGDVIEGITIEP